MNVSSRSTDGLPSNCPLCGKRVWVVPSDPAGDATCPHCGNLVWVEPGMIDLHDPLQQLAKIGVESETDDEGEIRVLRFSGVRYNDSSIGMLLKLGEIPVIDISKTAITPAGAKRLRERLPHVTILYEAE